MVAAFLFTVVPARRQPAVAAPHPESAKSIAQYGQDQWTHQNGLPGETVYQVLQTDDGYLWLRTSNGLVRFDGVQFVQVDPVVNSEPIREQVRAICKSAGGDLLIRTASRTLIYKNGAFSDHLPPSPLPDGVVVQLLETSRHEVIVGADNFLYLVNNSGVKLLGVNTGPVEALVEDHTGTLWIGSIRSLHTYRNGKLAAYRNEPKDMAVNALAEDSKHNLWLGTRDGLYRIHREKPLLERVAPDQIHGEVHAIMEDLHGDLWVGTLGAGVFRLANGKWSSYKAVDGLSDNNVLSLYEDREGSIWVGTTKGLNRFRDTKLTTFTSADGLPSNNGGLITGSNDGGVYVFCGGSGLARIKNGVVIPIPNQGRVAHTYAGSLFMSRDGSLWIGAESGLRRFKDGAFTYYTRPGPLSIYISAINEDEESLIFTARLIAYRLKNGKVQPFTFEGKKTPLSERASGNYTFNIYRDPSGTLWFGTVRGLFKFAKGEPPENALQKQITFPVTSIFDDGKGYLWLGGRTPGLTRFRIQDGRVTRYTSQQGLFDEYPSRILTDRRDNLWVSTPSGIYWISRKDMDDVAEGRIAEVSAVHYDTADGMKTTEAASPDAQPAAWRTADGKLWFMTREGIVLVDPDHIPHNGLIPPVHMEEIVVDQKPFSPGQDMDLKPGVKDLELHYTALSLLIPQRVRFKYQLEGYDRDWVDAGTRRVAYYTNLPPGNYHFRVIASNDDGLWNTAGDSFSFRLEPHVYQTGWFYGLCLLGAVLMASGLHGVRTQRLRARARQLTRLVDERTQELRQYKDHLEDQVVRRTAELSEANTQLRGEIIERKNAEDARRESQQLLQAIIDNSPALIFVKDVQGRYLLINRRFEELFHTSRQSIVGKTDYDLFPKDHADAFRAFDQRVLASGTVLESEEIAPHDDGLHTYISIKGPLCDETGKPYAVCGIATDITERKNLEEQLRQAQKMEAIGRLAGGIAHDFNNLLTIIAGYSDILRDTVTSPLKEKVEAISKAGERASSLTRQLLSFSRGQMIQPKVLNLNNVLTDMETMLRRLVREDIELVIATEKNLGLVQSDPGQVEQVILNLVINARDAMPDGGKLTLQTANVTWDEEAAKHLLGSNAGAYIRLTVSDTGSGMDAETQAHIFEPFFTTKGHGKGTGLGLATVYGIVKQAGGHIAIESQIGRGTAFHVYLPRTEGVPLPEIPLVIPIPTRGSETILVVEDQEGVRTLVCEILRRNGYTVLPARDGREALLLSEKHHGPIDLLVTDVVMPQMGGPELTKVLAPSRPKMKVLFMSGYVGQSELSGPFFLQKPFTPEALAQKIREVLDTPKGLGKGAGNPA